MRGYHILLLTTVAVCLPDAAAVAQDAQQAPPPPPPTFSIDPGRTPEPENPNIQGPSDPEAPPQRRTPRPAPSQPSQSTAPPPTRQPDTQQPTANPSTRPPATTSRPQTRRIPERTPSASPTIEPAPTPNVIPDAVPETVEPNTLPPAVGLPDNSGDERPEQTVQVAPDDTSSTPSWWWILAGLGLFGAFSGVFLARRRKEKGQEDDIVEAVPETIAPEVPERPVPSVQLKPAAAGAQGEGRSKVAVPTPLPKPAIVPTQPIPASPAAAPPPTQGPFSVTAPTLVPDPAPSAVPPPQPPPENARIDVEFAPTAVRLTPGMLAISYRLFVGCVSDDPISDVSFWLSVRSADRMATDAPAHGGTPELYQASLGKGESQSHQGELRLEQQHFKPVPMAGKQMLVPIVDLHGQYTDVDGVVHNKHLAVLVGQEHIPQNAKVSPFPLDQVAAQFSSVGCRPLEVPASPAAAA